MKEDTSVVVEDPRERTPRGHYLRDLDLLVKDPRLAFISIRDVLVGGILLVASVVAAIWWLVQPSQTGRGIKVFPEPEEAPAATAPAALPFKAHAPKEISDSEIDALNGSPKENSSASTKQEESSVGTEAAGASKAAPVVGDSTSNPSLIQKRFSPFPSSLPVGLPSKATGDSIPTDQPSASDSENGSSEVVSPASVGPTNGPLKSDDSTSAQPDNPSKDSDEDSPASGPAAQ